MQRQHSGEPANKSAELTQPHFGQPHPAEEEGRDAWNRITVAAIQLAGAKDTERFDEAHANYRTQFRSATRLVLYGNAWLTELATRERTLASEVMVVEAEEELRQQDLAKQQKQTEALSDDRVAGDAGSAGTDNASAPPEREAGQERTAGTDGMRSASVIPLQTDQTLCGDPYRRRQG
ncbi:hypothetical protein [Brucella intermedia]|uniref:hypothetical protein n=1 Tax=Brucella intermedia TaxID=94625 RepID=UPI00124E9F5D|nr:hypothetical protein [Brucella intermedia]KAB2723383.1 hypothetical protein F9L02_22080 [Brucella intermedia]